MHGMTFMDIIIQVFYLNLNQKSDWNKSNFFYFIGKINKVVDTKHADIEFESGYVQKKLNFKYIRKLFDSRSYFSVS